MLQLHVNPKAFLPHCRSKNISPSVFLYICCGTVKTNLCGRAKICRGTAGAGVRQRSAGAAAHRWGRSRSGGRFRDAGGLPQDAVPLEPRPRRAPTEKELVQKLDLGSDRSGEEVKKLGPSNSAVEGDHRRNDVLSIFWGPYVFKKDCDRSRHCNSRFLMPISLLRRSMRTDLNVWQALSHGTYSKCDCNRGATAEHTFNTLHWVYCINWVP